MSWHSLPALVAGSLDPYSLAIAYSPQLRSTRTAEKSSCGGKRTVTSRCSLCGTTLEPSMVARGVDSWISFLAGSLANHSPRPESDGDTRTNGTSGPRSQGFLAKYEQASRSWRTSQDCFDFDTSGRSSVTFTNSGSMRNGAFYPQPDAEPRTFASASGFWRSPTASEVGPRLETLCAKDGSEPKVGERVYRMTPSGKMVNQTQTLGLQVRYPTPTVGDSRNSRNATAERNPDSRHHAGWDGLQSHGVNAIGGALNPPWVEWLMGWPIGWTDLQPLATDRFHSWLRAHSLSLRRGR